MNGKSHVPYMLTTNIAASCLPQNAANRPICKKKCQCNEHLLDTVKYDHDNRKTERRIRATTPLCPEIRQLNVQTIIILHPYLYPPLIPRGHLGRVADWFHRVPNDRAGDSNQTWVAKINGLDSQLDQDLLKTRSKRAIWQNTLESKSLIILDAVKPQQVVAT